MIRQSSPSRGAADVGEVQRERLVRTSRRQLRQPREARVDASFYTQRVDAALAEISRLPGRHLYFLDDHLLGDQRFARSLFDGMEGMNRLFQGAATVDSILRGDLIERAADAGLRSLFVGFETLTPENLRRSQKRQNLGRDYSAVTRRLHSLGIMINGSFVFGMDDDDEEVFRRTVDWAVENGITTATFHIQTPYPGTGLHARLTHEGRLTTNNWDLYDTRHVVFRPARLGAEALKDGYDWAYREFYRWPSIAAASFTHGTLKHRVKHFAYAAGWKKFEFLWNAIIRARQLRVMTPMLEAVLAKVTGSDDDGRNTVIDESRFSTLPHTPVVPKLVTSSSSLEKNVIL